MTAVKLYLALLAFAAVLGVAGAVLYGLLVAGLSWLWSLRQGARLDRAGGGR